MNYKITISYDGTHFSGWQIQPHSPSIQERLNKALSTYCREAIRVTGSGRTDRGVHAHGQVAHFEATTTLSKKDLTSLNALLPSSITINQIEEAPLTFHACRSATAKIYIYHIFMGREPGPFIRPFVTSVWDPIDLDLLQQAASLFIGRHDFAAFANVCKHRLGKSTVRTLHAIEIETNGPRLSLTFKGEGFLYKMVRNLVGGMLLVATHKLSLQSLEKIFHEKKRTKAIPCAPPQGLFLQEVAYETSASSKAESLGTQTAPLHSL